MPLSVIAKMESDELTVPVERDVMMNRGLAEDISDIFCDRGQE